MHRARRTGLIVCAIALLAAGLHEQPGRRHRRYIAGAERHRDDGGERRQGRRQAPPEAGQARQGPDQTSPAIRGDLECDARLERAELAGIGRPWTHVDRSRDRTPATRSGQAAGTSRRRRNDLPTRRGDAVQRAARRPDGHRRGLQLQAEHPAAVAECHDRGLDTGLPDCNISNVITYAPGAKVALGRERTRRSARRSPCARVQGGELRRRAVPRRDLRTLAPAGPRRRRRSVHRLRLTRRRISGGRSRPRSTRAACSAGAASRAAGSCRTSSA